LKAYYLNVYVSKHRPKEYYISLEYQQVKYLHLLSSKLKKNHSNLNYFKVQIFNNISEYNLIYI